MSQETEILSRVIGPQNPSFTMEAARSILALRFGDAMRSAPEWSVVSLE
jgi:hypothetical protein